MTGALLGRVAPRLESHRQMNRVPLQGVGMTRMSFADVEVSWLGSKTLDGSQAADLSGSFPFNGVLFPFWRKGAKTGIITRYISRILSVHRHIFHITISFDFHYDSEEDIITFNICCPQFTDGKSEAQRRQRVLPKGTQPGSDPDGIRTKKFWLQSPPLFSWHLSA